MIRFELPSGSDDNPWLSLLRGAAAGRRGEEARVRVTLRFADALPPAARPRRDPSGRYVLAERGFHIDVAPDRRRIDLRVRAGAGVPPHFPRHLIGALANPLGWILLHASAIRTPADGNETPRALVFGGASGAGKTTLACQLLAGAGTLIDDDLNVCAVDDRGTVRVLDTADPAAALAALARGVQGTTPSGMPLGGLFLLRQADRCGLRAVSAAEAATRLLALPLLADDEATVRECLARVERLAQCVSVRELCFPEDGAAVRAFLAREGVLGPC